MLKVSNLSVARGGVSLLQDVTFEVQAGQALVLRGPNGIGKTSLLRCISGLQTPTSGEISAPESVAYAAHADGLKGQLSVQILRSGQRQTCLRAKSVGWDWHAC